MEDKDIDLKVAPKIELTTEQQLIILKEWNSRPENPPSIPELMKLAFPDLVDLDPRTIFGRKIKQFLSEKGIKLKPAPVYTPKGAVELTDEHKEYITNNGSTMKAYEMARVLFNNPNFTAASQESRTILAFLKTIPNVVRYNTEEDLDEEYSPPNTIDRVCARVNKYLRDAGLDYKKLTPKQKKQCDALLKYLHDYRFLHQIKNFDTSDKRQLFEAELIKCTYDKEDLSQEDLSQYIILAVETVLSSSSLKTIAILEEEQERTVREEGKISMAIVEAISVAKTEYNESVKRQQSLYKGLTQQRSQRLDEKINQNASVLNIVEAWKNKESRDEMIRLANKRKQKVSEEIDRIESMDELKAKWLGLSRDEILEG